MEKALYYQTYPLGTLSISKLAAIITLVLGIIGTMIVNTTYAIFFLILYIIALIYNIKFRSIMCGYYGKIIHSKLGKIFQKFPPIIDLEKVNSKSGILVFLSINSYIIMIFPVIGGVIKLFDTFLNEKYGGFVFTIIILAIYISALILPSIILKKKIFPAFCEA